MRCGERERDEAVFDLINVKKKAKARAYNSYKIGVYSTVAYNAFQLLPLKVEHSDNIPKYQ
jgi:hypothetical protein